MRALESTLSASPNLHKNGVSWSILAYARPSLDDQMPWIEPLHALINALVADRSRLAFVNIALRQQVIVLKRSVKHAKIEDSDWIFWILMRRMLGTSWNCCEELRL